MKERRYRMLLLEEQTLIDILRGRVTVKNFDLPADAHVVGVHWDYSRLGFAVAIQSAQFDPVPLGVELPLLPPFLMRVE